MLSFVSVLKRSSTRNSDVEVPEGFGHTMSELEGLRRKHTIMGLYAELEKHPGLLERRLYVGSQKPALNYEVSIIFSIWENSCRSLFLGEQEVITAGRGRGSVRVSISD